MSVQLRRAVKATFPALVPAIRTLRQTVYREPALRLRVAMKALFDTIDRKADAADLRVNIGGGHFIKRHWKVLDVPPGTRNYLSSIIDYGCDLCTFDPLPFADGQVRLFYTSHCLEHLPEIYCRHLFKEVHRSLKPGGAIRITVPDYDKAADAFEAGNEAFFCRDIYGIDNWSKYRNMTGDKLAYAFVYYFAGFMAGKIPAEEVRRLYAELGREAFANEIVSRIPLDSQGVQAQVGNHINWFTKTKLIAMLKDAGFGDAYVSERDQSRFPEMRTPWHRVGSQFDHRYPLISLYVEAVR